jgi:hypothetical protein
MAPNGQLAHRFGEFGVGLAPCVRVRITRWGVGCVVCRASVQVTVICCPGLRRGGGRGVRRVVLRVGGGVRGDGRGSGGGHVRCGRGVVE